MPLARIKTMRITWYEVADEQEEFPTSTVVNRVLGPILEMTFLGHIYIFNAVTFSSRSSFIKYIFLLLVQNRHIFDHLRVNNKRRSLGSYRFLFWPCLLHMASNQDIQQLSKIQTCQISPLVTHIGYEGHIHQIWYPTMNQGIGQETTRFKRKPWCIQMSYYPWTLVLQICIISNVIVNSKSS